MNIKKLELKHRYIKHKNDNKNYIKISYFYSSFLTIETPLKNR